MRRILLALAALLVASPALAQSSINARQVQMNGQRLDAVLGAQLSVTQFGAVDDNSTDNTAAFQAAIAAATARKRTLVIPAVTTGSYRVSPSISFGSVNLRFEEGAQLKNLDGAAFTGLYTGVVPLAQTFAPGLNPSGKRVEQPGSSTLMLDRIDAGNGYAGQFATLYQGNATASVNPYTTNGAIHAVGLLGQAGPSSGSFGVLVGQINNYANTNGPGVTVTGTLTNGSAVITNINTTGMFDPAQVTSTTAGVPINAWIVDGGITANTLTMNAPFTGTTTTNAQINVVSGFSELTPIAIGSFDVDGPTKRKTVARYFDFDISGVVSSDPNDQDRYLSGLTKFVVKYGPGNVNDKIRRGSNGDAVVTRPGGEGFQLPGQRATTTTYPLSVGRLTWGYSGDPSTVTGGQSAAATPGALVGSQIGGVGQTVWDRETQRSYFYVGEQIEDYEQDAISIKNPRTVTSGAFTGRAITVAQGAGDIRSGDHFGSNGASPTFASQSVSGHVINSADASDAHFTVTAPSGSTGWSLTWAKPYTRVPDVVCASSTGTQVFYTPTATGIAFAISSTGSTTKFSCIAMAKS